MEAQVEQRWRVSQSLLNEMRERGREQQQQKATEASEQEQGHTGRRGAVLGKQGVRRGANTREGWVQWASN